MIKIDLNNLTQEIVESVTKNMGACRYTAPCILGALMTPSEQIEAENTDVAGGDTGISMLIDYDFVGLPAEQRKDAEALQLSFDNEDEETLRKIAARYIKLPA